MHAKGDDIAPLTEADLAGHLVNEAEDESQEETKDVPSSPLAEKDYQLKEALNLLKGINIVQQHG
jgi:carboxyl-terminal processing protease